MDVRSETAPPSPARRRIILLVKIAVSVGLLALLVTRSDAPRLWSYVRSASIIWLAGALGFYLLMVLASAWRWGLLLRAQGTPVPARRLTQSFLVATFFNNFLPSNIGGDVVRITDTAKDTHSRTLAATVVLMDRGIGLLGLGLVAAVAASLAAASGSVAWSCALVDVVGRSVDRGRPFPRRRFSLRTGWNGYCIHFAGSTPSGSVRGCSN